MTPYPHWRTMMTALITPMHANGKLDLETFKALVERQMVAKIGGVIPCGTTGEAPLLSMKEHLTLAKTCMDTVAGRAPVIVGAGGLTVESTLEMIRHAEQVGAQGVLVVTPYYIKPSQNALYSYYETIHDECSLPILLYNNPGRSGVELTLDTIVNLAESLPKIVGLKDSNPDITRATRLRSILGDDFLLMSGDDFTTPGFLAHGGDGAISVTSNIGPREAMALHQAWQKGDHKRFRNLSQRLLALAEALFAEASPGGVKYMAHLQGFGTGVVRKPLGPLSKGAQDIMEGAFAEWSHEQAFDSLLQTQTNAANQV